MGNGKVTTYGHDAYGRRNSATGPFGEIMYQYTFDNKRITTIANGSIEDRTWDDNELLETLAENGARISRMAHGVNGRPNNSGDTILNNC